MSSRRLCRTRGSATICSKEVKDIEDVKVKDLVYIVNTESGVVHRPVVWGQRMLFRNVGGLFVAGPSGLVSTRSRRCRRWVGTEQLFKFFCAV